MLAIVAALCFVVVAQQRENQRLQDQLDGISVQLNAVNETAEQMRNKHEQLEELVRNPPVRLVPLASR